MKLECITEKGGFGAEAKIKIYSKSRSGRNVKMERERERKRSRLVKLINDKNKDMLKKNLYKYRKNCEKTVNPLTSFRKVFKIRCKMKKTKQRNVPSWKF